MTTLTDLLAQTALLLDDPNGRTWSSERLTLCVRLALDTYNRVCGAGCTLTGLDGAAATSLPECDLPLLVRGAGAYAGLMRTLQRAESANLGQQVPEELRRWAETLLAEYLHELEAVRAAALRRGSTPWTAWLWDEDD
jgi:hypothetical protein